MTRRALLCLALFAAAAPWPQMNAQGPAVTRYDAIADRDVRPEPSLPSLGGAGSSFFDPVFASQLWRVTDGSTRPAAPNRSYRTPSGTHQNAWSADGAYFYVVSTDGTVVPFAFDAAAERARRIEADGSDGGLVLRFYNEPHFSYTTPGVIYGPFSGPGATLRTIDAYDFSRRAYERVIDLDRLVPGLDGTYVGGIGSSGGEVERLLAFFGGTSQDRHRYAVVFDRHDPGRRRLVDTVRSTLDGRATNIPLNFSLHHASIERSGRFALLYPTAPDRQAPRSAAPVYLWDIESGTFTELPSIAARANGHDAYGYGVMVNQDCCTSTTWDAAQWQFRSLAAPLGTRDLIAPVVQPKSVFLAEHPTWHNARPDLLTPFVTALYRYGGNTVPWRPWDDEIVAIETAAADSGATVWRFAHHRSDVSHDDDTGRIFVWYTPRPNISPDGRWVLFTSNWEKRLGTDPGGEPGGRHRQDVFLLKLRGGEAPAPDGDAEPVQIATASLPSGRRNAPYSATLEASGGRRPLAWRIERGSLPPGLDLEAASGRISGTSRASGTWFFTAAVTDGASTDRRTLVLTIRR